MSLLFEQRVRATTPGLLEGSDSPLLLEDGAAAIAAIFTEFSAGMDAYEDLEEAFDSFMDHCEFDANTRQFLANTLIETVSRETNGRVEDDDIKSFLKSLARFPKSTKTTPNEIGLTPLAGEHGTKAFLKTLVIQKHDEPFGNDAFNANRYKAFDRLAHRFGKNYDPDDDYNNQRPSRPLASPTLNVDTNNRAFEAVDSVGMNARTHWRVVNTLTGDYVTNQIEKTVAEHIADEINREFVALVQQHNRRALHEANIPSTEIQHNLLKPLDPRYVAAFEKKNWTMGGSVAQSGYSTSPITDMKAAALLVEKRKEKFGENDVSEHNAIRTKQQKHLKK